MMKTKAFASVWYAIEDSPPAAASIKARSALMIELSKFIETQWLTQAMLLNMASAAGMSPVLKISKPKALHPRAVNL